MKLTDKTLIYDDDCPLCAAYTNAFVKTGLLERRQPFSSASAELLHTINWQRSKNEIPLLDPATKKVWYGIDALLEILGGRFPLIKTIGRVAPINYLLKKLYNFISYNRKVIVAVKTTPGKIDCTPSFNVFYRLLFLLVFLVFNSLMLYPLHRHLLATIPFYALSIGQLALLHFIIVGINCTIALCLPKHTALEYLGQVNMLALIAMLLLVPLMITHLFLQAAGILNYTYLALLAIVLTREYFRRMHFADILYRYQLIVFINLLCMVALCIFLFVPIS
jgi:predicted DCC family thiol-disulfide oxidoreductase YuxK